LQVIADISYVNLGILTLSSFLQSLLLRKALKMQQDDEERKNEIIFKGLEDKIKKLEDSLKEKDELLCSVEGSLVEVQAQNKKLSKELTEARTLLEENFSR
jgi:septal ring factor EnvC (AmiA/AmiB activator)